MFHAMTDRIDDEPLVLDLPELDGDQDDEEIGDDALGLDDPGGVELSKQLLEGAGDDPFDDAVADDLPIDVQIDTDDDVPTIVGDDAKGLQDEDIGQELALTEDDADTAASFLDDQGRAEEGLEMEGDDELGIDPIPREVDDGGLEGLDDPAEERVDVDFPPLDGDDDEDEEEEMDLGIEIGPPAHPMDEPLDED
jgi:hypothetical protein